MNDVSGPITVLRVIVQFINTEELMSLVIDDGITVTELMYVSVATNLLIHKVIKFITFYSKSNGL